MCGGEAQEITMGAIRKAQLPNGQWVYSNIGSSLSKTKQDLVKQKIIHPNERLSWERLDEYEKVPATRPCDKCQKSLKAQKEVVEQGGIYVRCLECGMEGALTPSAITELVREQLGIAAPEPCGMEFDKCSEHEQWTMRKD